LAYLDQANRPNMGPSQGWSNPQMVNALSSQTLCLSIVAGIRNESKNRHENSFIVVRRILRLLFL
jgi:hypothetical protein